MNTKEKLQKVIEVLQKAGADVIEVDGSFDRWDKDIKYIEGIVNTLKERLSNNEVHECNRIYKTWKNYGGLASTKYDFKNKHFAFTGFRDTKLVELLNDKYGSIVHNTITGSTKLDYLICADISRQTVKMKRAQQQGAVIMTREELYKHF
jgi:hypothetical protein